MILKMAKAPRPQPSCWSRAGRIRIKALAQAEGKAFFQADVEHLAEETPHDTEIEAS